ncbi:MAG TPA: ABC transporter permease [Candidatus Acidoferrales bacterium]|nr:ABC transporter permease [Candidatus Acidoferrales bacterium]
MFWRVLWQLLRASRGRLAVALVAVAAGAAVCSALVNLNLDAERKLTREFRTLGANVVISPARATAGDDVPLLEVSVLDKMSSARVPEVVAAAPYLYVVARAAGGRSLILAGTWLDEVRRMSSWWTLQGDWVSSREDTARCLVGRAVAKQFHLVPGGELELRVGNRTARLVVAGVVSVGGTEDNQVFVNLPVAQQLAALDGRMGVVQMSVTGSAAQVENAARGLARALPGLDVRPIRQIADAEGQLLSRIRVLILATVVLILALTALCVLATMAALAMERRRDVGLMKAIGGSMNRVVRLFLTEAAILGVAGGALGWAGGVFLSGWIGRSVFGSAISPRPEVLPLTVALMFGVALAGALPLRLLGQVRPAEILRGE